MELFFRFQTKTVEVFLTGLNFGIQPEAKNEYKGGIVVNVDQLNRFEIVVVSNNNRSF